jgi:hypothetical protein
MDTLPGERVFFNVVSGDLTGSAQISMYGNDGQPRALKLTERVVIYDIQVSSSFSNTVDVYGGVNNTGPLAGERMFNILVNAFGVQSKVLRLDTPAYSQVGVVPRVKTSNSGAIVITGHAVILAERQSGLSVNNFPFLTLGAQLAAWYDGSRPETIWADVAGTTPATTVAARWDDLSPNSNILTNSGTTDRPNIVGSGLVFDGVNDTLMASFTLNQPAEFMAVWKIPSGKVGNERFINAKLGNNVGVYFQIGTPTKMSLFDTALLTTTDSLVFDAPAQVRGLFNNAASEIQINRGTTTSGTIAGTDALGGLSLGQNVGSGLFGAFTLYELIVSNAAMSPAQRTALSAYLLAKWGA